MPARTPPSGPAAANGEKARSRHGGNGGERTQWRRLERLSRSWKRRSRPGPGRAGPGARPPPAPARAWAARTVPASRARGRAASRSSAAGPAPASIPTTRSPGNTGRPASPRESGKTVFEQKDVEVPASWSQLATNVVVSKYFRGHVGTPEREHSVRQLIDRVVNTIAAWAETNRYFATDEDLAAFQAELTHLLVHQKMASTRRSGSTSASRQKPQCSACFINSVQDNMSSIMDLAKTEAMLFKYGSGAGVNLSPIRSTKARMSGGGIASGPVSFMRGYDAFAGVIKSGGKTRRAAKMVILDVDHPDVVEFIDSKAHEEKKAWALIEQGYDPSFTGEAYGSVFFQNANHSVRVTDDFMRAVERDAEWQTHEVSDGQPAGTYKARDIFRKMADAAHLCGDPGIQYDTTINDWHTSADTDRIYASNPCSEYMFLNDTACNLASLNLMKFVQADGEFDVDAFRFAAKVTITAQEILVDNASYPTPKIEENSHRFRPLGLGYANLGALLMNRGLAYDSDEGHNYAGAITALMHGEAYRQSSIIARDHGGAFVDYDINREPFLRVIGKHRDAAYALPDERRAGGDAGERPPPLRRGPGARHGARLPQRAGHRARPHRHHRVHDGLRYHRHRARHRAHQVQEAGRRGLPQDRQPDGARRPCASSATRRPRSRRSSPTSTSARPSRARPASSREHLPVFDCAFKPVNGERSIHYMGHIRMMGAVQPFLSGAISKTVNMPENATAEEIETVYLEGWKQGLKAIAIYRDGSKRSQPLSTGKKKDEGLGRGQGDDRGPAPAARVRPGRGHPPASPPPPVGADRRHAQVRDRRPRGLHHRRPVPGRPARRDLPQDGEGRLHDQRPDGHAGDLGQPGAPVRRAAARTW